MRYFVAGMYDTQFFITYERQPHLNNVYTVFGRVLDGWDVLDQMERLPVEGEAATKKKNKHRPMNPPVITRVTIHANPLADDNIIYPTKDGPAQ
jgi:peptidyl-prolyl cis-trans isomerase-like 3